MRFAAGECDEISRWFVCSDQARKCYTKMAHIGHYRTSDSQSMAAMHLQCPLKPDAACREDAELFRAVGTIGVRSFVAQFSLDAVYKDCMSLHSISNELCLPISCRRCLKIPGLR